MDPLTSLYTRLREQRAQEQRAQEGTWPDEPPRLDEWLRYWNDDDSDLGNLRNFEHWLEVAGTTNYAAREPKKPARLVSSR